MNSIEELKDAVYDEFELDTYIEDANEGWIDIRIGTFGTRVEFPIEEGEFWRSVSELEDMVLEELDADDP